MNYNIDDEVNEWHIKDKGWLLVDEFNGMRLYVSLDQRLQVRFRKGTRLGIVERHSK